MSPVFLNVSSIPWFLISPALIPGVLFSKRISSEVSRKDFVNQIVFSVIAALISLFYGAALAKWLYGSSAIAVLIAKAIAGRQRSKIMSAFR